MTYLSAYIMHTCKVHNTGKSYISEFMLERKIKNIEPVFTIWVQKFQLSTE